MWGSTIVRREIDKGGIFPLFIYIAKINKSSLCRYACDALPGRFVAAAVLLETSILMGK